MPNGSQLEELCGEIQATLKNYPDFPKKGVVFCDIMPLFQQPTLLNKLCKAVAEKYRGRIDAIAGLEARGFLFAPLIAVNLNIPFFAVRKAGKLPGTVQTETYNKEYGTDTLEIQLGEIDKYKRVLVLDDLLATGGTLVGACNLIERAGGRVTEIVVLIELQQLMGRGLVEKSTQVPIFSLLKYKD